MPDVRLTIEHVPGFVLPTPDIAPGQHAKSPAWQDESGHVFNGQSNVYVVPASLVDGAFEPDPKP